MLDTVGITDFDYHPFVKDSKVTPEDAEASEAAEDDEATPIVQDPLLLP